MASSPNPVTAPTKTMPFEEFYEKSDNANKLKWIVSGIASPVPRKM